VDPLVSSLMAFATAAGLERSIAPGTSVADAVSALVQPLAQVCGIVDFVSLSLAALWLARVCVCVCVCVCDSVLFS
jgi:hypothetical protein